MDWATSSCTMDQRKGNPASEYSAARWRSSPKVRPWVLSHRDLYWETAPCHPPNNSCFFCLCRKGWRTESWAVSKPEGFFCRGCRWKMKSSGVKPSEAPGLWWTLPHVGARCKQYQTLETYIQLCRNYDKIYCVSTLKCFTVMSSSCTMSSNEYPNHSVLWTCNCNFLSVDGALFLRKILTECIQNLPSDKLQQSNKVCPLWLLESCEWVPRLFASQYSSFSQ